MWLHQIVRSIYFRSHSCQGGSRRCIASPLNDRHHNSGQFKSAIRWVGSLNEKGALGWSVSHISYLLIEHRVNIVNIVDRSHVRWKRVQMSPPKTMDRIGPRGFHDRSISRTWEIQLRSDQGETLNNEYLVSRLTRLPMLSMHSTPPPSDWRVRKRELRWRGGKPRIARRHNY